MVRDQDDEEELPIPSVKKEPKVKTEDVNSVEEQFPVKIEAEDEE